jgi:molybdopterin synthase sulfur carrier subunit
VRESRAGYILSEMMTVKVLLFASYADALGKSAIELDVAPGSTVRDILGTLSAMRGGDRLPPHPLVAVNEEYASASTELRGGEEVAIIPPVAGG